MKNAPAKMSSLVAAWEGAVRKAMTKMPQLRDLSFSSHNEGKDSEQRVAQFRILDHYWLDVGVHLRELDAMLIADVADERWVLERIKREYQHALAKFSTLAPDLHPVTAPVNPRAIETPAAEKLIRTYEPAAQARLCKTCGTPMRVTESVQAETENGRTVHYRVLVWECDVALHPPEVHAERMP